MKKGRVKLVWIREFKLESRDMNLVSIRSIYAFYRPDFQKFSIFPDDQKAQPKLCFEINVQNVIFRKKIPLKIQKFSGTLLSAWRLSASGSKDVTEINGKIMSYHIISILFMNGSYPCCCLIKKSTETIDVHRFPELLK